VLEIVYTNKMKRDVKLLGKNGSPRHIAKAYLGVVIPRQT